MYWFGQYQLEHLPCINTSTNKTIIQIFIFLSQKQTKTCHKQVLKFFLWAVRVVGVHISDIAPAASFWLVKLRLLQLTSCSNPPQSPLFVLFVNIKTRTFVYEYFGTVVFMKRNLSRSNLNILEHESKQMTDPLGVTWNFQLQGL